MSFSTFMARIGQAAPTMLLIRDKGRHVFGGVAQQPWRKQGGFYGDGAAMLFGLLPCVNFYAASGINNNLQWCGVGFSELPNGVGFGGQQGHFGCFIDSSMETGQSRPNATFAAPCLASQQVFHLDVVECWALKPADDDDPSSHSSASGAADGRSVLDKSKVRRGCESTSPACD